MNLATLFNGWGELARVILVGAVAYVTLVLMLRVSGKRTLSKLNAFDFVVTVALGSTLATILLSSDVSLAKGLTVLLLLIGLQFLVSWTSVRWASFDRLIKAEPAVLLRNGRPVASAMRRERIAQDELLAAVRAAGGQGLGDAEVIILESDGSLSAVLRST